MSKFVDVVLCVGVSAFVLFVCFAFETRDVLNLRSAVNVSFDRFNPFYISTSPQEILHILLPKFEVDVLLLVTGRVIIIDITRTAGWADDK